MEGMKQKSKNGMQLARDFYKHCRPILMNQMADIMEDAALGLAGEGSECFGMDDQYSQDHDFGAAFCIWLPREKLESNLPRIEAALTKLPAQFQGFPSRMAPARRNGRVGPMAVEDFYLFFTRLSKPPQDWEEWLSIPEYQLAAATNGEVFEDNKGLFSHWRQKLIDFYPRDVWLKKLAARAMLMAQSGQYNLPRMLKRGDKSAALLAAARFAEAALGFTFLTNKKYMPFYKWAPALAVNLPVLGREVTDMLNRLPEILYRGRVSASACDSVDDFCSLCAEWLRKNALSAEPDSWLWAHGPQIMSHIENKQLLARDMLKD